MMNLMWIQRAALTEELEQSIWQYKELQAKEMVGREGVVVCVCACVHTHVCLHLRMCVSVCVRETGSARHYPIRSIVVESYVVLSIC